MKRSSLAIALLAAVLFSACNNGSKPPGSSKSPTASVSSSVPSAIPTETEEERHERERKSLGYSPENPPPSGFAPASTESPQPGHLTLEVKFNPTCVERGKSTKLTARTNHPKTRVSFVTPLADEKGHAIENDGRTDEKGLWTWEFMVPVNSAPHTYEMLGAAQDDEGAGEAHNVIGNWFFVVADPGQCT
ncbi:MAG: hypothetical protein ABIS18_01445 [Actinomycetota bacterium]